MAQSAFSQLVSRYNALPRNQQQLIIYGTPALIAVIFGYLTWKVMGELGADPDIHRLLQRDGMGKWEEIAVVDNEIAEKEKIIARKPEVEKLLADLRSDIDDAEQRLPREAEKAQMREVIERLAREIPGDLGTVKFKGVRILEAAAGPATAKKSQLDTVTYQVEVAGDLNGLIKYIDSIEKNTRFMSVNKISLKPGGVKVDDTAKTKLAFELHTVSMDLVTYVYASGKVRAKP